MSKVTVVQKPGDEIPTEIIARSIREISDGMKKVRAGQLNDRALVLLIQAASGVNQREVRSVLSALDNLAQTYLKKKTP